MNNEQMYMQYRSRIKCSIRKICYQYNMQYLEHDIEQDIYIYFIDLMKKYNPNYNGNVMPLDNYLFKNINLKIKSLCQKESITLSRALPSDIYPQNTEQHEEIYGTEEDEINAVLNQLQPEIRDIIKLKMQGYNQTEIKTMLGISQSKVSNVLKAIREGDISRYDIEPIVLYINKITKGE